MMVPSYSVIICGFLSHCVELMILPVIQEAFVIEGVIWVISVKNFSYSPSFVSHSSMTVTGHSLCEGRNKNWILMAFVMVDVF